MANIQNNYITIQGWMATDLKLKSNDLLVFALIFGFCQDGESEFTGSINYICEWLNCSRPTVSKSLDNLVELGLIEKRTIFVNNVTFNRYKIYLQGVKKLYGGSKETLWGCSKETLHHKDNINTIITTEEKISVVADEKIEYPNIEFDEVQIKPQIKNDYNTYTSHAPIISIETFEKEYLTDNSAIESLCMLYKIPKENIKAALKEFKMVCKAGGKDENKTNAQFKSHFSNWVRVKIQKSN